jgi:hypothetical protein
VASNIFEMTDRLSPKGTAAWRKTKGCYTRGDRYGAGISVVQPRISFIHVRKTGGNAIKHMLRDDERFELHKHELTLTKIWRDDPNRKVFFVVRDPVSRFISGFNSRLRNGGPSHVACAPAGGGGVRTFQDPERPGRSAVS